MKKAQVCHSVLTERLLYMRPWIPRDEKRLIAALTQLTAGLTGEHGEADIVYVFATKSILIEIQLRHYTN